MLILNLAFNIYVYPYGFLVRPIVAIFFLSTVRARFFGIFIFLKDAIVILLFLFAYVLFSSTLFYIFYRGGYTQYNYFTSISATYNQLLIVLTTANFPDIMLPAYNVYYIYAWGFVIYFVVAFYFLLNILIANVFNMFRIRLEQKAAKRIEDRI